jgi:hypothetical protein
MKINNLKNNGWIFILILMMNCGVMSCISTQSAGTVEETDILVVGGGTSGVIAAIQAAEAGCKTTLLEVGSQLGGTMTTGGVNFPGLFHAWGKQIISGIGWKLISEVVTMNKDTLPDFKKPFDKAHWKHQIPVNGYLYALLAEQKCLNAGVNIRYYEFPVKVKWKDDTWMVKVMGKGGECTIKAKQIVDCTGDAAVVSLAGYNRIKENDTQPGSLLFELEGYDYTILDENRIKQKYDEAIANGSLLKTDAYNGIKALLTSHRGLATQHVLNANSSTSTLHTQANIEGRKSLFRILKFIKTLPGCENVRIKTMQPETAIRETYRIDGMYRITSEDYTSGRIFDDALSYSYYPIDLHIEQGVDPKHLRDSIVATVPLRALIPKGSKNIIVAGRCVSSDRLANSALRVQASCMAMGQAAGAVAAIACKNRISPENVSLSEVKKLLIANSAIVP